MPLIRHIKHVLITWLSLGVGCLAFIGCSSTKSDPPKVRQPSNCPERFLPADPSLATSGSAAGSCVSPLIDPRDGTLIRLVRSAAGRGDYEVTQRNYGVGSNELLRIDCATGKALGIVPR
jgi:hypothetical protein